MKKILKDIGFWDFTLSFIISALYCYTAFVNQNLLDGLLGLLWGVIGGLKFKTWVSEK